MIPNKRIEDVIRWFHAYKRWFNPRSRLLLVGSHGGFERYVAMLHHFIARIGAADVHFLGHVVERGAGRVLRGRRRLPVRQRARRLLRAAHRKRSTWACRCWRTPPPPCRPRWTAPACSVTDKDPVRRRRADRRRRHRRRAARPDRRRPGRRARSPARRRTSRGTLLRFVERALQRAARAPAGGLRLLGSGGAGRGARRDPAVSAGRLPGAAQRTGTEGHGDREQRQKSSHGTDACPTSTEPRR